MAQQVETNQEATEQLWTRLAREHVCMLWLPEVDQHPQPMSHFPDADAGVIWFITSSETDLAKAIEPASKASMTFVSSKQDYHASVSGKIDIVEDSDKLDELWSTPVAAWFEGGREDPTVRLLRFTPDEAAIWASQSNRILVGLKLLRAGMSEGSEAPDVGVHRVISLGKAA